MNPEIKYFVAKNPGTFLYSKFKFIKDNSKVYKSVNGLAKDLNVVRTSVYNLFSGSHIDHKKVDTYAKVFSLDETETNILRFMILKHNADTNIEKNLYTKAIEDLL